MSWVRSLNKEHYSGALMILVGAAAIYFARPLEMGTAVDMGPGYFPTALGIILTLIGVVIAIGGGHPTKASLIPDFPGEPDDVIQASHEAAARKTSMMPDWRGWGCLIGAFVAFIVLFTYAGAVAATTAIVMISTFGERGNSWKSAIALAAFANIVLVVVFWWALEMPFVLFGGQ
jgi:hypothetical protein